MSLVILPLAWIIVVIIHAIFRSKYNTISKFTINTEKYYSFYLLPTIVIFYNKRIYVIFDEYEYWFTNIKREENIRELRIEILLFKTIITQTYKITNIIEYESTK